MWYFLFCFQPEAVHDDRLVRLAVGVVAADVPEDEDPAIRGLHRTRIVGRSRHIQLMPGLPGVAGPMDAAGRHMENRTFSRGQHVGMSAVRERRRTDLAGNPSVAGLLEHSLPANLAAALV